MNRALPANIVGQWGEEHPSPAVTDSFRWPTRQLGALANAGQQGCVAQWLSSEEQMKVLVAIGIKAEASPISTMTSLPGVGEHTLNHDTSSKHPPALFTG